MLPSNKSRFMNQNRQLSQGVMTESVDPHKAQVIHEAKKNQLVKKWSPVLGKCREVSQQKMGLWPQFSRTNTRPGTPTNDR